MTDMRKLVGVVERRSQASRFVLLGGHMCDTLRDSRGNHIRMVVSPTFLDTRGVVSLLRRLPAERLPLAMPESQYSV